MRTAALWFPEWSAQSAQLADAADDSAAVFTALVASLDEVASAVEILRPGLVVVDAGAAARFHGSEETAVEMMVDATARAGLDCLVGVADELDTALIAAHQRGGCVVPPGASREFLATQPVTVLAAEVALGCPGELVRQLQRLGMRELADVAALPSAQLTTRFGKAGQRVQRIVTAAAERRVTAAVVPVQLTVGLRPEEPLTRVDAAAFAARQLAAQLHERLVRAGQVCVRLTIAAEFLTSTGEMHRRERTWRTREALGEAATADRVRWQLDGWLSGADAGGVDAGGGIVGLELIPVEVMAPEGTGLWGGEAGAETGYEQARRVIERVQSQLGIERVLSPREVGGRGVAERIELVPFGQPQDPVPAGTWPGRIPAPLPARLGAGPHHPAARMQIVSDAGEVVIVTEEVLLSAQPHAVAWGNKRYVVAAWAGPWPVGKGIARLQLVGQAAEETVQRAWLLQWQGGRWCVEAAYF